MLLRNYNNKIFIFNLCCLYVFLLWSVVTRLIIKMDNFAQAPQSIAVVLCILYNIMYNKSFIKHIKESPTKIWVIWFVYTAINISIQGQITPLESPPLYKLILQLLLMPTLTMIITIDLYIKDEKRTLFHLVILFVSIAILTLKFDTVNDDWGTQSVDRFGTAMGNSAALNMVVFCFIIAIIWSKKYIKTKYLIVFLLMAITLVMMIQTRKALMAIFIIIAFSYLTKINLNNPSSWIKIIFAYIFCLLLVNIILDYTAIGERYSQIQDEINENPTGIAILDLVGDRALHYYLGWFIFTDNPIFGIGIKNAPYYSHLPYIFHTEYITQLSEGGIIGFMLFSFFILSITHRIIKGYKQNRNKDIMIISLGGISAILFLCLTAWIYDQPHYFILFGIIIAELNKCKVKL